MHDNVLKTFVISPVVSVILVSLESAFLFLLPFRLENKFKCVNVDMAVSQMKSPISKINEL